MGRMRRGASAICTAAYGQEESFDCVFQFTQQRTLICGGSQRTGYNNSSSNAFASLVLGIEALGEAVVATLRPVLCDRPAIGVKVDIASAAYLGMVLFTLHLKQLDSVEAADLETIGLADRSAVKPLRCLSDLLERIVGRE